MKTTTCCSPLEKQGFVVVLTRLRVVIHIECVERHIKMISELITGLLWSPPLSALEPHHILLLSPTLFCYKALLYSRTISYDCKYMRKLLCCIFVIESEMRLHVR